MHHKMNEFLCSLQAEYKGYMIARQLKKMTMFSNSSLQLGFYLKFWIEVLPMSVDTGTERIQLELCKLQSF